MTRFAAAAHRERRMVARFEDRVAAEVDDPIHANRARLMANETLHQHFARILVGDMDEREACPGDERRLQGMMKARKTRLREVGRVQDVSDDRIGVVASRLHNSMRA